MYGRVFESMYTGSMMGSGAMMFAVWGYVLTHQQGNRDRTQFTVELNSKLIAVLIGEKEEDVEAVLDRCCQPDPESRSQVHEGRKLLKLGSFLYEVVNGEYYDKLKREVDKREADRIRQERHRQKQAECSTGNNGSEEWTPTAAQLRLGSLFKRKESTRWGPSELKAFEKIGEISEEDLVFLENYYRAKLPETATDIRRRDLVTLLNNFFSELDRARKFREPRAY